MGSSIPGIEGHVNCDVLVGYKAVYRICFGMAMFFLFFSLLMIKVKSSQDPRAALHNGWVKVNLLVKIKQSKDQTRVIIFLGFFPHDRFWFFKFAGAAALTVGAFFISDGPFTTGKYY